MEIKELFTFFGMILFFVAMLVVARKEIHYQKTKLKIDGSLSERLFFTEQLITNWWCRNRFLCDVKKKRINLDKRFTHEEYLNLTVVYRTNPSKGNLEQTKKMLVEYFA